MLLRQITATECHLNGIPITLSWYELSWYPLNYNIPSQLFDTGYIPLIMHTVNEVYVYIG